MQAHIRKFILAELSRYRAYKKQIAQYEAERAEVLGNYPVATWQSERVSGGSVSDSTASAALRLERMDAAYARARFYAKAIEGVLDILPDEHRQIVELHCITGLPAERVEMELHLSKTTMYRNLNEVLPLFALRMGL